MTFPSQAVLADRLKHIEGSPTLALAAKAKALAKAGKPVLDFTAGEPDVPTPQPIKQAGIRAIEADQTRYTPVAGIPELRSAIAASVKPASPDRLPAVTNDRHLRHQARPLQRLPSVVPARR